MSALGACGKREQPPERPSQPTLSVAPDPTAPTTGRRVVAAAQIAQPWHVGAWAPASVTLSDVAAGDAIVVVGIYWGDLVHDSPTAPTDDRGPLVRIVDQGPAIVGRKKPPVFAQLYAVLDAAPGAHTIVPPYLGGPAGDGTMYVVQIRGLTEHRVVASHEARVTGAAIAGVSAALLEPTGAGTPPANPVAPGDLVVALGGYDNTALRERAGFAAPLEGWRTLGAQHDASNNVPSEARYRVADAPGPQATTWTWTDPTVNVAAAVIAALR